MGWATFGAIFSQTHPVTLLAGQATIMELAFESKQSI
jgi:hypothetical protein